MSHRTDETHSNVKFTVSKEEMVSLRSHVSAANRGYRQGETSVDTHAPIQGVQKMVKYLYILL